VSTARENAGRVLRGCARRCIFYGETTWSTRPAAPRWKAPAGVREGDGVETELTFTDVAWDFPESVDSAFYHVVQESLMNSFCHGKATRIRISSPATATAHAADQGQRRGGRRFRRRDRAVGHAGEDREARRRPGSLVGSGGGFDVTATVPAARGSA